MAFRGPFMTLVSCDLVVFGPGQSHVYRVDPDTHESFLTAAHVWAGGLTTIYGCTFDREGNFWATEMFHPNKSGPPGDLVRIPFENPASVQHIGLGSVVLPGGIKQGLTARCTWPSARLTRPPAAAGW